MQNKTRSIVQFMSCTLLLFIAYIPMFRWMIERWVAPESYYGHGFIIPIVSLYIIWQRRECLKKTKISSEISGLIIVAIGLFVHVISALLRVYFISGFSFIFVIYGLVLFFFGKEMVRNLVFPIFFLLVMIPIPLVLIGNLTVKLKLFAAQCATVVLNRIGFSSILDGSTIRMPNSYVAVEAPCSGLRSLISLLTLGLLFAFAMKRSYLKKGLLLLSSIPIALTANVFRITLLAIINDLYGTEAAAGFLHDFSGFLLFAFAFTGLLVVGKILESKKDKFIPAEVEGGK